MTKLLKNPSKLPRNRVSRVSWFLRSELFRPRSGQASDKFATVPSSETQGQAVEPGEKARRKFSTTGGRAPGYRLSQDHFQTVKRMLAPDWAQKMLCIIVPNRRTVSPEFFSWVRTRRLLSRHSCPVRSPSFPNQKRRNYRWVEKRFGCYQQEQFNLHWENSVSDGSQCIVSNRKFKMRRRRTRNPKKQ